MCPPTPAAPGTETRVLRPPSSAGPWWPWSPKRTAKRARGRGISSEPANFADVYKYAVRCWTRAPTHTAPRAAAPPLAPIRPNHPPRPSLVTAHPAHTETHLPRTQTHPLYRELRASSAQLDRQLVRGAFPHGVLQRVDLVVGERAVHRAVPAIVRRAIVRGAIVSRAIVSRAIVSRAMVSRRHA